MGPGWGSCSPFCLSLMSEILTLATKTATPMVWYRTCAEDSNKRASVQAAINII